ncbi:MAG: hypothetical protein LBU05_07030 [Bifidobacteriaceae bacterium]|nr:hypothetical protein [Bifidobacteriaceae bacterium]
MELFRPLPVVGVEAGFGLHDGAVGPGELGLDAVVFGQDDLGEERLAAQSPLGVVAGLEELVAVGRQG